ncbi:MAG: SAM-dependent methyltransferase, partial [Gammaproteobacteria bacterium]
LLHHLHAPQVLWQTVRNAARSGATVVVMDLLRPPSPAAARDIVQRYAACEPEVLQTDFYHSLCAAFTPDEVRDQLAEAGLSSLTVAIVSDRHLLVSGRLP